MTAKYTAIASRDLSSASSSVVFTNIPQIYRDLMLVHVANSNSTVPFHFFRFNNDNGNNYSRSQGFGNGVDPFSGVVGLSQSGLNAGYVIYAGNPTISEGILHIFDYAQTDKQKSFLVRGGDASGVIMLFGGWTSTSAVTSITISTTDNNFSVGSKFWLFGVR